jgi:ABC-2 type transport system permease protein
VSRFLRSTLALYAGHMLTYWRSRTAIYWSLAFPIVFLVIFGLVFGRNPQDMTALMPRLFTITLISGSMFGVALRMVTERENGILRRHHLTPVSPVAIVLAHGATAITTLMFSLLVQGTLAHFLFHFTLHGSLPSLAIVLFLSALALIPIGLVVGSVARDSKVAPAMANFLFFPLMFLSGSAIPLEYFPTWAQRAGRLVPTTYAMESLTGVVVKGMSAFQLGAPVIMLLLTSVIGVSVNGLLFRWESTDPVRFKRLGLAMAILAVIYGVYAFSPSLHLVQKQ